MSAEVREPSAKYLAQTDYQSSDIGPIPRDWTLSTVGDEFNVQLGKMLDADRNVGIEKPYLGNRAVQWGRIDASDVQNIRMSKVDLEKFRLRRGDLLVCEGGEVGRAAIWDAEIAECYYQKALHRLRPLRGYEPSLMQALLQLYASRGVLSNYVTQTSIAHLPKEKFVAIPIPRPEPEEQRAIATALSEVDALIAGLEKLIAKKRDLKQAAMQQLLTGQTRLPGFSGQWAAKRLGDLAEMGSGGTPPSANAAYYGGEIPWVAIADMTGGGKYIASTERNLSVLGLANSAAQMFPAGTVLYAMYASLGECSIATVPLTTSQAILGIRPKADLHSEFLYYVLTSWKSMVKGLGQQGTQANLNKGIVADFKISLPAFEEQISIAAVLVEMDTELVALESRLTKTRELKQGMMQELLTGRTRLV
jgi:type I restriction enzyme S subunit